MKKAFILMVGLILLIFLSSCSDSDKQDFYGTYTFEKVSYLSPLSSSTIDYMNERMAGTKYTIEADSFKIEDTDKTVEVSSPNYVKEEIQNDLSPSDDVKYQYTIYSKDGDKTNWRLYASSTSMYIASYVDNTADGSEIIMSIFKLSK